MKNKFIYLIVSLIVVLSVILVFLNLKGETKSELKTISLGEVTHSPFYAPLYVAINEGYFKDEGLNVEVRLISGANNVISAVLGGDVDVGFCGPEATIYVYNAKEKDYVQTFAGLTKRDGQFLVSRTKIDNFDWNMLKGKEVLAGRIGGMPELNFENALKMANVTKKEVNINTSVDFASLSSAFISGTGDFVNLYEPNATKLEKMKYGYIVASIGEKSGEMPYTAFNAKKSYIEKNKDVITSFRKAIDKGLLFVKENDEKVIAKSILKSFSDTSLDDLESIIKRYKDADSWLTTTKISKEMFENLEDVMIDSGQIKKYVDFDKLIIND